MFLTSQIGNTRSLHQVVQTRPRKFGSDRDGGNVAAARQCFLRRDGPNKPTVEIFRAERPKSGGCVFQHGHRMQHTLIECQRVNEWFQG